jgi:pimeloyl-ACP methyl ester carboxylesterase
VDAIGLYRAPAGRQRIRDWCTARLDAWPVPHRTASVDTGLGPVHVLEAGSGPDTVVYLPGTNFNTATSLPLLTALASRCRVVSVDLPGQPGLSTPTAPATASWLSDVLAARAAGRPGRTVLAGHSRGGHVALCADPAQVDALALLDPAGLVRVGVTARLLRTAVPWVLRPSDARSAGLLRLMTARGRPVDPELTSWLTMVARDARTTGAPGPVPERCSAAWRSTPVRVVSGADDCFFPVRRLGPAVRRRLGCRLDVLPGVGHLSVDEAPDVVAERVLAVLQPG